MREKIKNFRYKKLAAYVILAIIITLGFAGAKRMFITPDQDGYNDADASYDVAYLKDGNITQYFTIESGIAYMDMLVENTSSVSQNMQVELYNGNTNDLVSKVEVSVPAALSIETAVNVPVKIDNISENTIVYLKLKTEDADSGIGICVQVGDYEEDFYQNEIQANNRVRMSVTHGYIKHYDFMIALYLLALVILAVIFARGTKFFSLENGFLVLAISTGIAMAIIGPAVQECDGWEHFVRAMDVSYGNVLGSFTNLTHDDGVIIVPANLQEFNYRLVDEGTGDSNGFVENLRNHTFSDETMLLGFSGSVTSVYYWPQGLGIWIGRNLHLSMYMVVILSRVCNLLAFAAITYFAIKLIPFGKNILTVIALMPMTIYQAASDSPDALLNAFCFLFVALCFRYAYDEKIQLRWKQLFGLGVLLTLIFMCKYVYICLGLLVFMIPMKRIGTKKQYWKTFAIAMIPLVLIGGFLLVDMLTSIGTVQASTGDMTQMQFILRNPLSFIKTFLNTVNNYTFFYTEWLNILGSFQYSLHILKVLIPGIIVVVTVLDTTELSRRMTIKDKMLCVFAAVLSMAGLLIALYIGDGRMNVVGAGIITGGQGRYFIAVLVPACIALTSRKVVHTIKDFSYKITCAMGIMLGYGTLMLMMGSY